MTIIFFSSKCRTVIRKNLPWLRPAMGGYKLAGKNGV